MLTGERPAAADPRAPAAIAPRRRRPWGPVLLFLSPALVLFGVLVLTPIAVAAYAGFFTWNGFGVPSTFVGLDNFRRLLADQVFVGDLERTLLLIVLSIAIQLPVSLALAMLLNQPLRGRRAYRMIFLLLTFFPRSSPRCCSR